MFVRSCPKLVDRRHLCFLNVFMDPADDLICSDVFSDKFRLRLLEPNLDLLFFSNFPLQVQGQDSDFSVL